MDELQRPLRRIPGLDALRTLAIAGVTLFHMFPSEVPGGYFGTSLFLVLTGFLLAVKSEEARKNGTFSVLAYYKRRIRRIYPALMLMLFASIGVYFLVAPKVVGAVRPEAISVILGYNNWWQILQNADYFTRIMNSSPFTHLWFIGIEAQYFLLWPLLFIFYKGFFDLGWQRGALAVVFLLALASAALMPAMYEMVDITRLYYGTDTRACAMLLGALMGLVYTGAKDGAGSGIRDAVFILCLGGVIAAYFLVDGREPVVYQGGMTALTLVFSVMVYLAAGGGLAVSPLLSGRVISWIGERSYGIFLWQYPVIYLFTYMGWSRHPLAFLAELLIILALSSWSDAVLDHCLGQKPTAASPALQDQSDTSTLGTTAVSSPDSSATETRCVDSPDSSVAAASDGLATSAAGGILGMMRRVAFFASMASGAAMMGLGCYALVVSDDKPPMTELQRQMEANRMEMEEANRRAAATAALQMAAQERRERIERVDLSGIVLIGDSILLGSAHSVREALPGCYIDAEVSRYVGGGIDVARRFAAEGLLGNVVVIALGTNGPIAGYERYEEQTRALLDYLGPARRIFWVNVYCPGLSWQQTNNDYIKKMAASHPNVTEVDWYSLISEHPDWLASDGVHPEVEGCRAYAKLLRDTIASALADAEP